MAAPVPHTGPRMRVASLRVGVILVLLIGLSGTPPCEEVAVFHARCFFSAIIELNRFPFQKFTGNENPAACSARLRFFQLTSVYVKITMKLRILTQIIIFRTTMCTFQHAGRQFHHYNHLKVSNILVNPQRACKAQRGAAFKGGKGLENSLSGPLDVTHRLQRIAAIRPGCNNPWSQHFRTDDQHTFVMPSIIVSRYHEDQRSSLMPLMDWTQHGGMKVQQIFLVDLSFTLETATKG